MENHNLQLAKDSWYQEKRSAFLYRIIAQHEKKHTVLFNKLAEEAEKQAEIWANAIENQQGKTPLFRPDLRTRLARYLIVLFGTQRLRLILAAMKIRGMSVYLPTIAGHPMPKSIADIEHHHKSLSSGNNIRAAVFGVNDGLVSNASLIMGMIGGEASTKTIILAGVAGLLAGAFSMGAGEYVSVRSQRELFEYQINLEKKELELYPEEEIEELALIYEARGLPAEEAHQFARSIMSNPENALNTLAREELGLNPDDLVSPYSAAFFSFISFTLGAVIPIVPFLFSQHNSATILLSIIFTALCLFAVGAILSLYTGLNAFKSGLRMLLIGICAGGITYFIGHLLGVGLL